MVYKNCLKFAHRAIIKLGDMLSCKRKEWEKRREVFKNNGIEEGVQKNRRKDTCRTYHRCG
ncbi:hypothetical protein I4000191A8_01440 [Clostridia bacterium i40-0019-1A8]